MIRETSVQSQVKSYQRLKKWSLMLPCLTLSIIRYGLRVKWSNSVRPVSSEYPKYRIYIYIYINIWWWGSGPRALGSPSLPLFPGSLFPGVIAHDRVQSIGQIQNCLTFKLNANKRLMNYWIDRNRSLNHLAVCVNKWLISNWIVSDT